MKRLTLAVWMLSAAAAFCAELPPEQAEFFENKIRPVLVERCYNCHSTEAGKDKGGLLLDSRDALLKGGDTGPALVAGDAAKSLLLKAVKRADPDTAMPPKGKADPLTVEQVADFETWIKMGAPDPRAGVVKKAVIDTLLEKGKTHWAFQAPQAAPTPPGQHPVDALLTAKGATAEPRVLIRRASLALTGLPPSPERVEAFVKESGTAPATALSKLLDELLASPHYGERWGRHWLDVARYADNMGAIFNGDDSYPFAFTYRDWVIKAFNEDKPYDRFLMEQIAADLLPETKPENNGNLAALGFLTLGRRTDRRVDDNVYDDRIDVISRGLLGLTAGCARCHDHKLEPIPTADYYALYGILKSCTEPQVYPALAPQPDSPDRKDFEVRNHAAVSEYLRVHAFEAERSMSAFRSRLGDYLLAAKDAAYKDVYADKKVQPDILDPRKLNGGIHNRVVRSWETWVKGHPDIFRPWLELAALPEADFAAKAPALCAAYGKNADKTLMAPVARVFEKASPKTLRDIADAYNNLWAVELDAAWAEKWRAVLLKSCVPAAEEPGLPLADLTTRSIDRVNTVERELVLPEADVQALKATLLDEKSPFVLSGKDFVSNKLFLNRDVADGLRRNATKAVSDLGTHPGAPVRLMALQEDKPFDAKVFIRGNPKTLGAPAPRGWFTVLRTAETPEFPKDKSGRLELAHLLASRNNPLTARVIVNRVWAWHFGEGIVKTPSDFGFRGEPPDNQALLDTLAVWFMDNGWSFKKLNRLLLSSRVWREARRTQPLDFESFRDSLLSVSGALEPRAGGKPDDLLKGSSTRRTVYALVDRKTLPNLFRNFDFPDPSLSAPRRSRTALAPQALFLLNSSFVVDRARELAKATQPKDEAATPMALKSLYQRIFQRNPGDKEIARAAAFLAGYPQNDVVLPEANDWSYGTGDFDGQSQRVSHFQPLKFAGNKVVGNGGMELTKDGGQPAEGKPIIRRWTAPRDGKVNISAELAHLPKEGDGITSRIVSSRGGLLGEWAAAHGAVLTSLTGVEVKQGDTLDFLTLCGADAKNDTFRWSPTITMPGAEIPGMSGMAMRWDAKGDFMDPSKLPAPLNGWEELAHVLLLSNEFAVVD
jgi:hypothetical protein